MGSLEPLTDLQRVEEEKETEWRKKLETADKKRTREGGGGGAGEQGYKKSKKNSMVNVQLIGPKGCMLR